jgi:hypothetical protein
MQTIANKKNIYSLSMNAHQYVDETDPSKIMITKDNFKIELLGRYIQATNGYYDTPEVLDNLVTINSIDLSKINTIYRLPNLALSRDKLNNVKEKYNIKVIRDMHMADLIVISNKTTEKIMKRKWSWALLTKSQFKKLFNSYTGAVHLEVQAEIDEFLTTKMKDEDMICTYSNNYYHNPSNMFAKSELKILLDDINTRDTQTFVYIPLENEKQWDIIFDSRYKLVSDVYMNQICSEDSIIIDKEMYSRLIEMLKSTAEDKTLAMSMMSNCNITESKTYIALLFYHFGEQMKSYKTWNQVAFKTLRKQFDKYMLAWGSGHSSQYSELIKKLAEDDALTTHAVEHILDLTFKKVVESSSGFNQDGSVFKIDRVHVSLKDEYKEKIKDGKTLSEVVLQDGLPF